jgi:superfamily I DNA/RNA helicase
MAFISPNLLKLPSADPLIVLAAEPEVPEEEIGEFQVAEYIVYLLALDTYMRYAEESSGVDDVEDALIKRGLRLLRSADAQIDALGSFLDGHLASNAQKTMLRRALAMKAYTPQGASRRALQFRTILSRGGPATMKGVFENQKYVRQVREAISAAMLDDADRALDVLAAIPMRNARLRDWIDKAAEQAGSGEGAPQPVDAAASSGSIDAEEIVYQNIQQLAASGAEEAQQAQEARSAALDQVERDATEAARKSLEVNQMPDEPPVRSEVVGMATAAVAAALSDPTRLQNVPVALRDLDDEQRAAALTEGRVLVAAGAGAGKSKTLVSRIDYLVCERKINPARIMACSFNRKAATELKEKIASVLGNGTVMGTAGVQIGTMHSLFAKLIVGSRDTPGFGTPEEQAMLRAPRLIAPAKKGEKSVSPASLSITIRGLWDDCSPEQLVERYGFKADWIREAPKAKKANLLLNKWRGNDIGLQEARNSVTSQSEAQAAVWYDMYLGIKGDIPGWRPPCPSKAYDNFMGRNRKGGERLGDLDDMLKILRDILVRDSKAKKTIQGMFDHILVDECQDMNTIQHQIFEMMSEHITKDASNRSIFLIGDDKQAIYQFRGAKPELFRALFDNPEWTTRMIRTNYRCQPEIVEAANNLIAVDTDRIPMEARADPRKDRGRASIQVTTPETNVDAAIDTIGRYRKDIDEGAEPENFAVLARTNAELNDFETACIINEIPYIRRGGRGFLEAPESRAVLGYLDLATGNDYEKMKKSLVAVLMKPDRSLFIGPDDVERAVNEALDDVARRERVDIKSVRPDVLLETRYINLLADKLKQPYRLKIINSAGDPSKGEWMYKKRVEELAQNLKGLSENVRDLREYVEEDHPTPELLGYVLDNMKSRVTGWDKASRREVTTTVTLREQITNDVAVFSDDDDDVVEEKETVPGEVNEEGLLPANSKEELEKEERKGLGAVQFLYALAQPNSNDQENLTDPTLAKGFVRKLDRYSKIAETLRIDPVKWEKEQSKIADEGKRKAKPPAITLSTVHSVKGAQWTNVSVMMPKGIFPFEPKRKPDEPPPDPIEEAARLKAERNLAYVALTRAAVNLEVCCPLQSGMSPFVFQAGLQVGENVPKPGMDAQETVKEAADEWYSPETY